MLVPCVFKAALRRGGEQVRWWRAVPCSCYDPTHNSFDETCTACEFGHLYVEQTLADDVRVLVTRERKKYSHPEAGLIKAGDLTIQCWPSEMLLTPMDKLVLLDRPSVVAERVRKGEDLLNRPYPSELVDVRDAVGAYTFTGTGADCSLNTTTRKIVWAAGEGPATAATYTVTYKYLPVYWFVYGDMTPTRPIPGYGSEMTPQQGYLVEKHPGSG